MGLWKSKPAPVKDFDEPWREVDWSSKELLISNLRQLRLNHPEISQFRILLHGPVGAGKSCFINSIMSIFKGRIVGKTNEESSAGKSCTKAYKTFKITDANCVALPFVLNDLMGLEVSDESGIHPDDIIKALHGHVKEGYKFNPTSPLTETDPDFNDPGPNDKVHCLVSVVSASSISQMGNEVIQKMKMVRKAALRMNIPHVVVMTKIDDILCSRDKNNLSEVYKSRKINEKMSECSNRLGPPVKYIFPVSNYYEEMETNDKKDVLILMALKAIAGFVQDYIEDI